MNEDERKAMRVIVTQDLMKAVDRVLQWHDRQGGHGALPSELEKQLRSSIKLARKHYK